MSLSELMGLTTAQSPPSTPARDSGFESDSPPPLLDSRASVPSLSPPSRGPEDEVFKQQNDTRGQGLPRTPSDPSPRTLAAFAPIKRLSIPIPKFDLSRLRSYPKCGNASDNMHSPTLRHTTRSRNPTIKVLLVLSPHPAGLPELTKLDALMRQFCAGFSSGQSKEKNRWAHISLYAHYRAHGADPIRGIHRYALREKLERGEEVQWRLTLPVLLKLIDEKVQNGGGRTFVVSGLKAGDLEGIRAFAEKIAEPSGILLFTPQHVSHTVPVEFWDRTVRISPDSVTRMPAAQASAEAWHQANDGPLLSRTYRALLAALYARALCD